MKVVSSTLTSLLILSTACKDPDNLSKLQAQPEICNDHDDNLDKVVDNIATSTCAPPNTKVCFPGHYACLNGEKVCKGYVLPQPEVCNDWDDDCDGIVDNPEVFPLEFCYSGSKESVVNSPCRPGVMLCLGGILQCIGQVIPTSEVCNEVDDDCDGTVDNVPGDTPADVFLVVIIDRSGSMVSALPTIRIALFSYFSHTFDWGHGAVSIMDMPGLENASIGSSSAPSFVLQRADKQHVLDYFNVLIETWGSDEYSYDAIQMALDAGATHILLFTDEEGQSAVGRVESSIYPGKTHILSFVGDNFFIYFDGFSRVVSIKRDLGYIDTFLSAELDRNCQE